MGKKVMLLQGNEACAMGALYAGLKFFAGYPITPSSEIAEILSEELPKNGGVFIQMEDEIASMGAIIGASLTGAKTMTATSGPGFSLKQENIGYACLTETPCVVVNVMRGGPSTGSPTGPSQSDLMQARWGTHGDHPIICLYPNSVGEIFSETVRAFNLSEKYRNPVILTYDEIVAHLREKVLVPEPGELEVINRTRPTCPPAEYIPHNFKGDMPAPMADFGSGYRYHVTGLNYRPDGFPTNDGNLMHEQETYLARKISSHLDDIIRFEEYRLDDAEVCVVAFGSTSRSAKAAVELVRSRGIKAGLFRIITMWPFPETRLNEITKRIKHILVPEMNLGQIINEVERCSHDWNVLGGIHTVDAKPIKPGTIAEKLESMVRK
jgi:2-oxoglutarate ferredoxin oxidoreductase subunit alpha